MSRGELKSVIASVGIGSLINDRHPDAEVIKAFAYEESKADALFEDPGLIKTPVVRNGKKATVGNEPEVWSEWIASE